MSRPLMRSLKLITNGPMIGVYYWAVRCCGKLNFCATRLPFPLIHRVRNDPILNSRDAWREGLVVGVNGKAFFPGIQVLLNSVGILLCPFVGFAISHKVIVGQVGRAVGVVVLLIVCRVVGVGDCHELVGQAKVQMALVQVSVPVVAGVVPG